MNDSRRRYEPPSVNRTAFNCPHCHVLTTQFWFNVHLEPIPDGRSPNVARHEDVARVRQDREMGPEEKRSVLRYLELRAGGKIFGFDRETYARVEMENIWLSKCYECNEWAVWRHEALVWPAMSGNVDQPNPDLPDDVRHDFEEAARVLDASPRGAAALLRLAIQKLCKQLGGEGENINKDIQSLVAAGLDRRVQRALDIVRVVGNNAVHPGQIDLRDDRATAEELFRLVNLIADIMITQPKHIEDVYSRLPEGARAAIEKRDRGET